MEIIEFDRNKFKNLFPFVCQGEGLRMVQDGLDAKNFYAFNPSFDK